MRSIFRSQKAVNKVLNRKSASLESHREHWFQSVNRKKTAKLLQLHELTLEILEHCRNSLDKGIRLMSDLEKQLKRMDGLSNSIEDIRRDLIEAQYYLNKRNKWLLTCCDTGSPIDRSKAMDRLRKTQVEEAEKELTLSTAVYQKFVAIPDDPSKSIKEIVAIIKMENPHIGTEIEYNVILARKAVKVVKGLSLAIAMELKLQGNQMPILSDNIDAVTLEIRLNNVLNVDTHNI